MGRGDQQFVTRAPPDHRGHPHGHSSLPTEPPHICPRTVDKRRQHGSLASPSGDSRHGGLHCRHTITDVRDDGEVVADHQDGQAVIATQAGQQVEDLGLDRDMLSNVQSASA
jgi:hypothetical protein